MAKSEPISTPAPSRLVPERDIKTLKRLLVECGPPTFDGAVLYKVVGRDDNKIIMKAAQEAAGMGYTAFWKEALTLMHKAYWSLLSERETT